MLLPEFLPHNTLRSAPADDHGKACCAAKNLQIGPPLQLPAEAADRPQKSFPETAQPIQRCRHPSAAPAKTHRETTAPCRHSVSTVLPSLHRRQKTPHSRPCLADRECSVGRSPQKAQSHLACRRLALSMWPTSAQ